MSHITHTQTSLGLALKKARHDAGLTQQQLADLAAVSTRPIYLFETGKGTIRLETYLQLLEVLGLELQVAPRIPKAQAQ
jgi:y4mF family transcriptional regulator